MKKILGVIIISLFLSAYSFAADSINDKNDKLTTGKVYSNSGEFLKAEGSICKTATDGCNTVFITDGKLGAMTKMYCEDIYGSKGKEKWSCTSFINSEEKTINKEDEPKMCTMQYDPVCGIDGKTYGNSCTAGKVEIAYKGECKSEVNKDDIMTYVNQEYLSTLLKHKDLVQKKLVKFSNEQLNKLILKIDENIEEYKNLSVKISKNGQKMKITQYVFLKTVIQSEIDGRK